METEKLKVSIIVPVYNVVNYLAKCIDSILAQDEQKWELILVDDGSNDGSGQICDNYAAADHRITVVHKQNEGVSIARNVGLAKARAPWISFVDSDDWVEPRYLSDMLSLAHNDHTMVIGNIVFDYLDGSPSMVRSSFDYGLNCDLSDAAAPEFIVGNQIVELGYPYAKIFNKKVLDKHKSQFNSQISLHEDHIFVLQYLLAAKSIAISKTPNYHYMHTGSATSLSKKKHPVRNMIIASDALIKLIEVVIERFGITEISYVKRLYTTLGLNQLVAAALEANQQELKLVNKAIRRHRPLFMKYYSPNHSYVKWIPYLSFAHLDILVYCMGALVGRHKK